MCRGSSCVCLIDSLTITATSTLLPEIGILLAFQPRAFIWLHCLRCWTPLGQICSTWRIGPGSQTTPTRWLSCGQWKCTPIIYTSTNQHPDIHTIKLCFCISKHSLSCFELQKQQDLNLTYNVPRQFQSSPNATTKFLHPRTKPSLEIMYCHHNAICKQYVYWSQYVPFHAGRCWRYFNSTWASQQQLTICSPCYWHRRLILWWQHLLVMFVTPPFSGNLSGANVIVESQHKRKPLLFMHATHHWITNQQFVALVLLI